MQVEEEVCSVLRLDDKVVDINFYVTADLALECVLHAPLIHSASVFQAKRHIYIEIYAEQSNKGGFLLIFFTHAHLVITRASV